MRDALLSARMNEALIVAVRKREPMWNPTNEQHRNVYVLKRLWKEVATEVQKDVKTVKSRWKNLRAYFYKELKKIETAKDGAGQTWWQYYDQLLFLKGHAAPEKDTTLSVDDDENDMESMMYEIPLEETQTDVMSSDLETNSSTGPPLRKKKRGSENTDKLLEMQSKRMDILEKSLKEKSDDLLFFESLLPYMSDLPVVRKLRLRSKIQDLILAEIQGVEITKEEVVTP